MGAPGRGRAEDVFQVWGVGPRLSPVGPPFSVRVPGTGPEVPARRVGAGARARGRAGTALEAVAKVARALLETFLFDPDDHNDFSRISTEDLHHCLEESSGWNWLDYLDSIGWPDSRNVLDVGGAKDSRTALI